MTKMVICGVGGQGIILASDILSLVAMEEGYDVKKSEVHGMAQRGGSVISNCVFGEKVYSPLIGLGEGDILLAFEKLEALRSLPYLKKNGKMIVNDYEWLPITVTSGDATYPEDIIETLKKKVKNLICVDGVKIAAGLGNIRTSVVQTGELAFCDRKSGSKEDGGDKQDCFSFGVCQRSIISSGSSPLSMVSSFSKNGDSLEFSIHCFEILKDDSTRTIITAIMLPFKNPNNSPNTLSINPIWRSFKNRRSDFPIK